MQPTLQEPPMSKTPRMPLIPDDKMTEAQKEAYSYLVDGPR